MKNLKIRCHVDDYLPLSELKPHPRNRNLHPPEQIDMYIKIITHQGIRAPIRVSNRSGIMTKGHGLLQALKQMGEEKAPVEYQDYDDDEMEYQDLIADNELQKWAKTDLGQVNLDIQDLGPFDLDFLASFQLLICNAIKIPITTKTISPIAYLKYFLVFPSDSNCCLIFLKNFIIG